LLNFPGLFKQLNEDLGNIEKHHPFLDDALFVIDFSLILQFPFYQAL
jgi:hypothetical protein